MILTMGVIRRHQRTKESPVLSLGISKMTQTTLGHELLRPETRTSLESGEQETGIKFDIAQSQEIVVLYTIKPKFSNDKNLQNEKYKKFQSQKI